MMDLSEPNFPSSLILALGTPDFGRALLSTLNALCGANSCSAFIVERPDRVRYLLSSCERDITEAKARRVSHLYAGGLWRHDAAIRNVLARPVSFTTAIRRLRSDLIDDPEYRRLYEQNGVVDRMSLYRFVPEFGIALGAYRDRQHGPFSACNVLDFRAAADTLSALVVKHGTLSIASQPHWRHPPIPELMDRFRQSGAKLSTREAQICAMFVVGQTDKEVARSTGLRPSSVATYRKRAYQKMGVNDRKGLARFYDAKSVN
jgi:DNA-binding CsgD family transcriptional regulator